MTNVEVAYLHELKVKMSFPDKKINPGLCMVDDFLLNCSFPETTSTFISTKLGRKHPWLSSMFIPKMFLKKWINI